VPELRPDRAEIDQAVSQLEHSIVMLKRLLNVFRRRMFLISADRYPVKIATEDERERAN
jgi:hypothetical protein